ncbi:MAG: hypothetical protein IK093_16430 [Ruminiclostridium sp.]|nr:hypothetical protein [Ruminiclostridium sp.]
MSIENILAEYNKKTITLDELGSLLKIGRSDTMELYETITDLVGSGSLKPVYNSGQNGNRKYPLYKKYRIVVEDCVSPETAAQINRLHPALLKSGHLSSHPKEYTDNREILEKLSRYLFHGRPDIPVSRKERSFEIFGREKILDDSGVKTLLRNLDITEKDLCFYDTPEYCFHDYIPERKDSMVLLICENKDIWFNIRRCMFEDNYRSLFGVPIDGVVYGSGNEVSQKRGALAEYVRFMGGPDVKFLYWGDIDREGFDIFRRTREVNPSLDIRLFIPGYRKMIGRARNLENEDSPSSKKEGVSFENLIADFLPDEKEFLNTVFAENKLVPQEIIPYTLLSER